MNEGESRAREYVEEPDSYMDVADLLGCGTACRGDSGTVRVHERHSEESPPRFPEDSIRHGIPAAGKVGPGRGAGPPDRAHEHHREQPGWPLGRRRYRWRDRLDRGFWVCGYRERLARYAPSPLSNRNRFHPIHLRRNWPAVGRRPTEVG